MSREETLDGLRAETLGGETEMSLSEFAEEIRRTNRRLRDLIDPVAEARSMQ